MEKIPCATFRCCDCEHEWAELLPPLYEDLPACYCGSGPTQLVELLEPDSLKH
jgi:hypothetical protein